MSLTSRARKFVILTLIALILPAWVAGSLPLVWCVGPNGHSAIENLVLKECQTWRGGVAGEVNLAAEKGCLDFSLLQRGEVSKKPLFTAGGSKDQTEALSALLGLCSNCEPSSLQVRPDAGPDQLAQLRTVVLLI